MSNVLIGQNAELPNINGSFFSEFSNAGLLGVKGNGAFYKGNITPNYLVSNSVNEGYEVVFDAKLGQTNADGKTYKTESVYRDGGEVLTQNLAVKYWKRIS